MQENSEMASRAAAAEAAYSEMEKTLANAKESVTRNLLEPWPLHHRMRASLPRTTSPVALIGSAPRTTQVQEWKGMVKEYAQMANQGWK